MRSGTAQEAVLRIDTSDLPAGAYFLRGTDGNATWSTAINKRH
jgi:hypothetical protein